MLTASLLGLFSRVDLTRTSNPSQYVRVIRAHPWRISLVLGLANVPVRIAVLRDPVFMSQVRDCLN